LNSADLESIAVKMGHYALAPDTEYPYEFVRELFVPLRSTIQVSRLRRKVLGIVNMAFAFRCYRSGDLNQIWRYSLRAISNDPSLLFNRGLARITFKGLVGTN